MERWFLKFTKEILLSYLEKLKTKLTLSKKVSFEENKTFRKSVIEKFAKFHSKQLHKQ